MGYQLNDQIVLGLASTPPSALTTDGEDLAGWVASTAVTSKIATLQLLARPLPIEMAPGVIVGAGLKLNTSTRSFALRRSPRSRDDLRRNKGDLTIPSGSALRRAFCLTPGGRHVSIGLGFRSKIEHDLEGSFHVHGYHPVSNSISADIELPEIVTLEPSSCTCAGLDLLGTVEWTNWSRLPQLKVICDASGLPPASRCRQPSRPGRTTSWVGRRLVLLGGSRTQYIAQLTLRGGVAYEISPIQNPTQAARSECLTPTVSGSRPALPTITANGRPSTSSYAHVFFEDASTSMPNR